MRSRLIAVDTPEEAETEAGTVVPSEPSRVSAAITAGLMLALKTLSQKTVVALASLVDLLAITSAFALWVMVIAQPTVLQLVGVGTYAAFVFATIMVRKK